MRLDEGSARDSDAVPAARHARRQLPTILRTLRGRSSGSHPNQIAVTYEARMYAKAYVALAALCFAGTATTAYAQSKADQIRILGPQGVNLLKLDQYHSKLASAQNHITPQDGTQQPLTGAKKKPEFRAQWFEQPLDHFDKKSKHTFHQRYWASTRHYKPRKGAPVIVLDGGETSGEVGTKIASRHESLFTR
jgi:hypothetical protein